MADRSGALQLPQRPRAGLQPCLAAPRTTRLTHLCALLDDGAVALLSPPRAPTASAPSAAPEVCHLLRCADSDGGAEAIALSEDGALLAIATACSVSLYVICHATATPRASCRASLGASLGASLCWRAPVHSLTRSLALSGGVGGTGAVLALASSMGLELVASAHTQPPADGVASLSRQNLSRRFLHPNTLVCCCAFGAGGALLAAATMDGRLYVHQHPHFEVAWRVQVHPLERVASLDFSSDARTLAAVDWRGSVAVYDSTAYAEGEAVEEVEEVEEMGAVEAVAVSTATAATTATATAATADCLASTGGLAGKWRLRLQRVAAGTAQPAAAVACWCLAPHAADAIACFTTAAADSAAPTPPAAAAAAAAQQQQQQPRAERGVATLSLCRLRSEASHEAGAPRAVPMVTAVSERGGERGNGWGGSGVGHGTGLVGSETRGACTGRLGGADVRVSHGEAPLERFESVEYEYLFWLGSNGVLCWKPLWPWRR